MLKLLLRILYKSCAAIIISYLVLLNQWKVFYKKGFEIQQAGNNLKFRQSNIYTFAAGGNKYI
jgi:hypothetical protein